MNSRQLNELLPAPQAGRQGTCRGLVLRFESLSQPGRWLEFPCDAAGRVDLDQLSDSARCNYLFARAVVGRAYSAPLVVADR